MVALLALPLLAAGQPFGRFGYTPASEVPGFHLDREGFQIKQEQADRFFFEQPSKLWKPLATTDLSQTIGLTGVGRSPSKVRIDLTAPGFSLYFQHGMGFRLTATSAPYLTWSEGSVGPGVPTPPLKWILLSFRDAQPPVLFASLGEPTAFQISGRPGDWQFRTAGPYAGWIRVTAPIGARPLATNTAAALGELKTRVLPVVKYLVDPAPQIQRVEVTEEPTAVTATWTFDRPYALLPTPAVLAPLGGYPLKLESAATRYDSTDPDGPQSLLLDKTLKIRFPVRRVPTGRSLALGAPESAAIGTVSPLDVPSVAELALANLPASRDKLTREAAEETLSKYLSDAAYETEPHTNQRLPFAADGSGLELAAAHALLMQSTITTVRATSEPNSLLTSVLWRRDWRTWRIWTPDRDVTRRAGALAALAAAICPEPNRRLDAAMLEAGLAAERGLVVYRARNGFPSGDIPKAAPLLSLRRGLFLYPNRSESEEGYARSLLSEVRVYGDLAIRAIAKDGAISLTWHAENEKPATILLASAYPLEASPAVNLATAVADDALGITVLKCVPKGPGPCEVTLKTPDWASPLPKYVEAPRFESLVALCRSLGVSYK